MSSIEDRPYAGTWKLNNRTVVKYTPDALIFINGDTSIPGCPRCRGRIDIQKFITSFNVEAGTTPVSHSASINLALPRVQGEQVFIDGYNILRPGLEVHIFCRGYFPVRGMFKHLADPQAGRDIQFDNPSDNDRLDLSKYATYPYYPVFHGVVTQVSYDYSDGFYHGSIQCASLLHFWQYQNFAAAGAWFSQSRPNNDSARPTLFGHNFNNVHPFGIMYTLYRDVTGAAGGVEFALDEQSNLDAPISSGDRQIFDQIAIYWEQRFKTRIQSLRMYGVNGQLFNAAQQAWLGSASSRDVNRLLPSPTYNDSDTLRTEKDPFSARLSVAKALGLGNSGIDFVYSPLIKQDDELVNLSILDMFAFTQAIGELGPGNLWQTTYQTKLDIAQSVMEVTGYEFYQDVDGDLVFKPPFYNLDTSSNRYYRLADQDIMSISFVEKEPTATYIIVRGTWFAGLTDVTKNTDELGKRGLYVDFKLVAKFGWRPGPTLDITYQTDPKVLFWIGVARLDALNVDTFSASCTIPIRAELRPGFPVFIPFCDCYYYISQLSHQFAFGGQCTTSLTLTCRRAKWHAPGFLQPAPEGQSAIELIRLDRPDLPPRPLEIFNNGIPRIVGFPNVVMALDPRKFDPNFSVVGVGIDYFSSVDAPADLLFSLLQRDIDELRAFEAVGVEPGADGRQTARDPSTISRFRLRYGKTPNDVVEFGLADLVVAFDDYKASREDLNSKRSSLNEAKSKEALSRSAENAFDPVSRQQGRVDGPSSARVSDLARLDTLEAEVQDSLRSENQALESKRSYQLLALIFEALQPQSNKPIRRRVDGIAGSDVTMAWFESLTHLKGQYMSTSLPGQYRYFSCSHPNEEMQGMPIIEWDDGQRQRVRRRSGSPGGTLARAALAATSFFPLGNNLFTDLATAVSSLPGIDSWLNTAIGSFELSKWLGLTNRRQTGAERDMDQTHAQRLIDIMGAVNIVVQRILARSDYQQAVRDSNGLIFANPQLISGFRPEVEPTDAEAFHSAGVAIDVSFANETFATADAKGIGDAYSAAVDAVRAEALAAYNEGLIAGLGFYSVRAGGSSPTTFVHMDRRDQATIEELKSRNPDADPRRTGRWVEPKVERNGRLVPFESWEQFARRSGVDGPSFPGLGTVPDRIVFGNNADLADLPAPPSGAPAFDEIEQGARPSIKTRELQTDVDRVVVQFKTTVTQPEAALRSPEVELGIGKCRKGIQIALGPQRTPQVLTTDQIQTVSFVRHQASKFASLVGTSQTAGRLSFNATALQKQLAEKFLESAQDLSDPETLVGDIFGPPYRQIAEDLASVPLPVYSNGTFITSTFVNLTPYPNVLLVALADFPASVRSQMLPDDDPDLVTVPVSALTFSQVASLPGYKPQGKQQDDGRWFQRAVNVLAGGYAVRITKQLEDMFLLLQKDALEPSTGLPDRLQAIQFAFNGAAGKAIGIERVLDMITKNVVDTKAQKDGKIEKPLHSPVYPVSDEKGYEHYGAYRYGRGLSVEPGGTFEFLHKGQDPFQNVTAQTAEEFLRVFTLVKSGKISAASTTLKGIQDATARMAAFVLEERQETLTDRFGGTTADGVVDSQDPLEELGVGALGLSPADRTELEQSVQDLAGVVTALGDTSQGQDALRELLTANGDNPDLLNQDSFDITDTQFARNFVNFAVNYGKSPVFKTTAANAAYQLADLTAHLLSRAGQSCVCRGSYADVLLAAYARRSFVTVEGINQKEQPAVAFASEQIIKGAPGLSLQQRRYRGAISEGPIPDAKSNPEGTT
jgi:hypothetical protein